VRSTHQWPGFERRIGARERTLHHFEIGSKEALNKFIRGEPVEPRTDQSLGISEDCRSSFDKLRANGRLDQIIPDRPGLAPGLFLRQEAGPNIPLAVISCSRPLCVAIRTSLSLETCRVTLRSAFGVARRPAAMADLPRGWLGQLRSSNAPPDEPMVCSAASACRVAPRLVRQLGDVFFGAYQNNGGIKLDPGVDIATHLNIVTSAPAGCTSAC